ncbi:MAG: hypothetical protein WBC45_06840 [Atribacterota bacterium]
MKEFEESKLPEEINQAIKDLTYKFMSIEDHNQAVDAGELVRKPILTDDMKFFSDYPDHPMAGENRFKRIQAADIIRDYSKNIKGELPQNLLDKVHDALFDCCAAVRHSIAGVLFYGGNDTSIPFLMRLLETEKESKIVKKTAEVALFRIKPQYPFPKEDTLVFASDNINLAIEINDFCKENNKKIFFPEPGSPDIIAVPFFVMVVDRHFIGKSAWEDYCDYSNDDNTPVIIIDSNLKRSMEKYPIRPAHDNVFLIEQWCESALMVTLKGLVLKL